MPSESSTPKLHSEQNCCYQRTGVIRIFMHFRNSNLQQKIISMTVQRDQHSIKDCAKFHVAKITEGLKKSHYIGFALICQDVKISRDVDLSKVQGFAKASS